MPFHIKRKQERRCGCVSCRARETRSTETVVTPLGTVFFRQRLAALCFRATVILPDAPLAVCAILFREAADVEAVAGLSSATMIWSLNWFSFVTMKPGVKNFFLFYFLGFSVFFRPTHEEKLTKSHLTRNLMLLSPDLHKRRLLPPKLAPLAPRKYERDGMWRKGIACRRGRTGCCTGCGA